MNLNDIPIGEIAVFLGSVGVIGGVLGWFYSKAHKIDELEKHQKEQDKRMDRYEENKQTEKDEILAKVGDTNEAVNLLCSAISVMIDNELNDNKNKESLLSIKQKLDDRRDII